MSGQNSPALPKFEIPLNSAGGQTSKNWYFFFQGLSTNLGTVQSVAIESTDFLVNGSPITDSGTIVLDLLSQPGVVPGNYFNANISVNNKGLITKVANGAPPSIAPSAAVSSNGGAWTAYTDNETEDTLMIPGPAGAQGPVGPIAAGWAAYLDTDAPEEALPGMYSLPRVVFFSKVTIQTVANTGTTHALDIFNTAGQSLAAVLGDGAFTWGRGSGGSAILTGNVSGNVTIADAVSGPALTIGSATNSTQSASLSTVLHSYGSVLLTNTAEISSVNPLSIGTNATGKALGFFTGAIERISIDPNGVVAISAPATINPTLTLTSINGAYALAINSGNAATTASADIQVARGGGTVNSIAQGPNIQFFDTVNNTSTILQHSVGQTELWQFNGGWTQVLKVASTREVFINAPASGNTLTTNGPTNGYAAFLIGSSTSGGSFGLVIEAGTTAADQAVSIYNASGTAFLFRIFGDGGVVIGSPTGGNIGPGTINCGGIYVNGVAH